MPNRIFNFSAGPAVLPLPVLEEAQRDLIALPGVGMSVMEISHRSTVFDEIVHGAFAAPVQPTPGVAPAGGPLAIHLPGPTGTVPVHGAVK